MVADAMQTVVETSAFISAAKDVFSDEEVEALIRTLAAKPESGKIMEGTGGVRKMRVALEGRGKSGGARVVYYYHSAKMPLFLMTAFAKNEKSNLSKAEKNAMAAAVAKLKKAYKV